MPTATPDKLETALNHAAFGVEDLTDAEIAALAVEWAEVHAASIPAHVAMCKAIEADSGIRDARLAWEGLHRRGVMIEARIKAAGRARLRASK
jgi:hypothetical protein